MRAWPEQEPEAPAVEEEDEEEAEEKEEEDDDEAEETEEADDAEDAVARARSAFDGPRLDFALATREGVEVHGLKAGSGELRSVASFPAVHGGSDGLAWSPDGRWLGLLGAHSLQVASTGSDYAVSVELKPLGGEASPGIRAFHFSPLGTYAVCYEPPGREEEPQQADSSAKLAIWRLQVEGEPPLAASFAQEKSHWPALKWTEDESHCCRMVRDEVQIFDGARLKADAPEGVIPCRGVSSFEVKGGGDDGDAHIALFVPGRSGEKARCEVHSLAAATSPSDGTSAPTASQELADADSAQIRWSCSGGALLVLTSTEVDSSGKSYYGETKAYFVRADGSHCTLLGNAKSGPVHDAAWCPTGDEFLLLQGNLPCAMTLHDGRNGEMALDFGKDRRNTIQWSPLGSFFALGGFGQLAGDITFWDRKSRTQMGETRYECCVDCQWSADGRHLLGWTTAPRMRVDNRVELFDYAGNRLQRLDFEELYSASWRPMPATGFPDRPPSPRRTGVGKADPKAAAKQQAYRAPHSDGALASRLRAEEKSGARTIAQTAEEQVAEANEARKAKAKKEKEERPSQAEKTSFREVLVPMECVGTLIGSNGKAIRELSSAAGLTLEVKTHKVKGKRGGKGREPADEAGKIVKIGPAGPWDDLDKAEAMVRKRIDDIKTQLASRKREIAVPDELVKRLIGTQGQSIQELSKACKARLRVQEATSGKGQVVKIEPLAGDDNSDVTLQKAESLILVRLDELREEVVDEIHVPGELVGGLIGSKGATIRDLERETDTQLKISANTEAGDGSATCEIGPGSREAVARAKALIESKLESLVSTGGKKGKGKSKGERDSDYDRGRWGQGEWDSGQWDKKGKKDSRWDSWDQGGWHSGNWWDEPGWWNDTDWGDQRREEKSWRDDSTPTVPRDENSWAARLTNGSKGTNGRSQAPVAEESPYGDRPSASASASRAEREAHAGAEARPGAGGRSAAAAEAAAPSDGPPPPDPVAEFRAKGEEALRAGDLQAAVDWFTKAVRTKNSNDLQSLLGRSQAFFQQGKTHEAFRDASVAVKLHPDSAAGHLRKGLAQKALGQDVYEGSLREALRLDPDCAEAKKALGLDSKKKEPAQSDNKAGSRNPDFDYCAECGDAAELGAIDEADGLWYCKACWEVLLKEDGGAEEASAAARPPADEPKQPEPSAQPADSAAASEPAASGEEGKTPKTRRLWADEEDGLGDLIDLGSRFVSAPLQSPARRQHSPPAPSRGRWDLLEDDRDDRGKGGKGKRDRDRDRGDRDRERDRDRDRGGGGRRDDDWDRRDEDRDRRKGGKGGGKGAKGGGKGGKASPEPERRPARGREERQPRGGKEERQPKGGGKDRGSWRS